MIGHFWLHSMRRGGVKLCFYPLRDQHAYCRDKSQNKAGIDMYGMMILSPGLTCSSIALCWRAECVMAVRYT